MFALQNTTQNAVSEDADDSPDTISIRIAMPVAAMVTPGHFR